MIINDTPALAFTWIARAQLAAKGQVGAAERWALANGAPPSAVRMISKGAVGVGSVADLGNDFKNAAEAFLATLQSTSVYYRLFGDGAFLRVPIRTRIGVTSATATGYIVGEGAPTPLSHLTLNNQFLEPTQAAALIVATDELIANVSASGQILFNKLLKNAIAKVVDAKFITIVTDGAPTINSIGYDDDAMMVDLRTLLGAVDVDDTPSLYFIVGSEVAKIAATYPTLFPAMSPIGGEMLNVPAVMSTTIDPNSITLINAGGIAADSDGVTFRASSQTNIQMADNPTNDASTGTGSTSVSMFQTGSMALMAVASFAVERLRSNAVATLQNIHWGGDVSTL